MEIANYKCDCCGKKVESESYGSPEGWFTISCNLGDEDKKSFWSKSKDICAECAKTAMAVLELMAIKAKE